MPFVRAIGSWMLILVLGLTGVEAQEQSTRPLTVPPYHNLPTAEGYFQGAGGVRLFYRIAGRNGDPIVFLHGGPGGGINIGGYDMEPLAARGHRLLMFDQRGAGRSEIITDAAKLRIEDFVQDETLMEFCRYARRPADPSWLCSFVTRLFVGTNSSASASGKHVSSPEVRGRAGQGLS